MQDEALILLLYWMKTYSHTCTELIVKSKFKKDWFKKD